MIDVEAINDQRRGNQHCSSWGGWRIDVEVIDAQRRGDRRLIRVRNKLRNQSDIWSDWFLKSVRPKHNQPD